METNKPKAKKAQALDGLVLDALLLIIRRVTPVARNIFLLLLVAYAFSGVSVVGPQETALELRFGRLLEKEHGPGLVITLPAPFAEVVKLEVERERILHLNAWAPMGAVIDDPDKRYQYSDEELEAYYEANGGISPPIKTIEVAGSTTLDPVEDGYSITGDVNIVQGLFSVRYKIKDAHAYYTTFGAVPEYLTHIAHAELAKVIASMPIDDGLTDKKEAIKKAVVKGMKKDLAAVDLGIEVSGFEIRELSPARQVLAAFEGVVDARMHAKTLLESAKEYRTRQVLIAQGQAEAIRRRAEAETLTMIAEAEGESEAFIGLQQAYGNAPELVSARLYWESLEQVMQQINSTTFVPPSSAQPTFIVEPAPEFLR